MYEIAGDLETAHNKLIRNANKTSDWYVSNLQKGNLSKYQSMPSIHNRTVSDIPLHFQGNTIESSDSLELLGVTIDDQLNFNIHINEICKRASQRVGVMLRLKTYSYQC